MLTFAAGAIGAFVVVGQYQVTLGRLVRVQAEEAAGLRSRPVMEPHRLGEALKRANAVAVELSRPWDKAFSALEAADEPGVALLSVEPDSRRGELRLVAEARDMSGMLAYLERLRSERPFARVALQQHEVSTEDPSGPIRFSLVAQWRNSP
jgi:hypothetical protein